ncbi:MAG: hypothetical protein KDC53_20090, partial [Saprospiraceae bacterium]|nr:hypothetical protein [Saprospiraceae bacterium]
LHSPLDLNILEILENEYHYFSNIPQGVGLGSSAALSASIYDLSTNSSHLSLTDKKDDLAQIESFFHGKSSGFDPLVSLEGSALIQSSLGISRLNTLSTSPLDIYLLYTGIQRDAHLLIEAFQKRNTDLSFKEKMNTLAILSSDNIESFSKGNSNLTDLLAISKLQYDCLDFLIIPEIKKIWENSFKKADYAIKLCGAGGGGCYLLFTEKEKLPEDIQCCQLEKLDL